MPDATDNEVAAPPAEFTPRFPESLEQLDLSRSLLADLVLKTLSVDDSRTSSSIADRLHLGLMITETILQQLYHERFIEAKGRIALHNHRYEMLDRGWAKVTQLMELCSYIGPAPVTLELYREMIVSQVRSRPPVTKEALEKTLAHLVLPATVKRTLGLVISSGRSLFLTGAPGNGKTAMARALVATLTEPIWIPYAIEVDNQIIRVFDKHDHHPVPVEDTNYDRRWIRVRPPLVVVGGELTIESLDLTATETPRYYEAPFQLKANGGVLLVDDFGRQRCSPRQLLNRWIIPLENRVDCLTLSTGKKVEVPFEQTVVFATNLTDADLVDAAFMRRMGYRLVLERPTPEIYAEIFRREAASYKLDIADALIHRLLARYKTEKRPLNACEPRDLILRVLDICRFEKRPFELNEEVLDIAWEGCFGLNK
jgi:predicted ATPase with chaperone activity